MHPTVAAGEAAQLVVLRSAALGERRASAAGIAPGSSKVHVQPAVLAETLRWRGPRRRGLVL